MIDSETNPTRITGLDAIEAEPLNAAAVPAPAADAALALQRGGINTRPTGINAIPEILVQSAVLPSVNGDNAGNLLGVQINSNPPSARGEPLVPEMETAAPVTTATEVAVRTDSIAEASGSGAGRKRRQA